MVGNAGILVNLVQLCGSATLVRSGNFHFQNPNLIHPHFRSIDFTPSRTGANIINKLTEISINLKKEYMRIFHPNAGNFGLPTRFEFLPRLNEEVERFNQSKTPFCMAWVNIDRFKTFNDTYGHPTGDKVLKDVARILKQSTRPAGFASRYGGDNFRLIFPGCSLSEGIVLAEKIRITVEEHTFAGGLHVTVRIGVDEFRGGSDVDLLISVDQYVYKARLQGGNCVCHPEI